MNPIAIMSHRLLGRMSFCYRGISFLSETVVHDRSRRIHQEVPFVQRSVVVNVAMLTLLLLRTARLMRISELGSCMRAIVLPTPVVSIFVLLTDLNVREMKFLIMIFR